MVSKKHPKAEICHIVDAYGGKRIMGEKLGGLTRQAIEQWEKIPASHVLKIEKDTGYSRYQIRPDIFGDRHKPDIEYRPIPRRAA